MVALGWVTSAMVGHLQGLQGAQSALSKELVPAHHKRGDLWGGE